MPAHLDNTLHALTALRTLCQRLILINNYHRWKVFFITKAVLLMLIFSGSYIAAANAQTTNERLPVNTPSRLPKSGTSDLQRSIRALQGTLIELQSLQLQNKQAHWNISGTLYYPLHQMLQEHYEGNSKYADTIAERLLSIGASSDGRAVTIVQTSNLPEIPGSYIDDARVLTFFISQYQTVGQRIYDRIKDVESVDPTSANLLQDVEHGIEKYQWQVRAEFQPTPTDSNSGSDINGGKPVSLPGK
jgi:starvation-inducible DNA-binding protein